MSEEVIQIKRYPNRRFYARSTSKYVSLQDIEQMINDGATVVIQDSQSGDDITRAVLAQIIVERRPDKMLLFPPAMLHFILRSNDLMSHFLRDYFRHSLTYLEYLQRHGTTPDIPQPMHWMKAWLDGFARRGTAESSAGPEGSAEAKSLEGPPEPPESEESEESEQSAESELASRVEQLERRLRELEAAPTKADD